jgi:hypothetical protein
MMTGFKKGERVKAVQELRLHIDVTSEGGNAVGGDIWVQKNCCGVVNEVRAGVLLVLWDETSTEDPAVARKMGGASLWTAKCYVMPA